MIGRLTGALAVLLSRLAHRLGSHHYLSTGCLHGEHAYCQAKTGQAGAKKPAECKFCQAACRCRCHGTGRPISPAVAPAMEGDVPVDAGEGL